VFAYEAKNTEYGDKTPEQLIIEQTSALEKQASLISE